MHSLADSDSLNESGGQLVECSADSGQKAAAVTDLAPEIPRNVIVLKTLLLLLLLLVLLMLLLVAVAGSRGNHTPAVTENI